MLKISISVKEFAMCTLKTEGEVVIEEGVSVVIPLSPEGPPILVQRTLQDELHIQMVPQEDVPFSELKKK